MKTRGDREVFLPKYTAKTWAEHANIEQILREIKTQNQKEIGKIYETQNGERRLRKLDVLKNGGVDG